MKYCERWNRYFVDGTFRCEECGGPLINKEPVSRNDTKPLRPELSTRQIILRILLCILMCSIVMVTTSYILVSLGGLGILGLFLEFLLLKFLCKQIWNYGRGEINEDK